MTYRNHLNRTPRTTRPTRASKAAPQAGQGLARRDRHEQRDVRTPRSPRPTRPGQRGRASPEPGAASKLTPRLRVTMLSPFDPMPEDEDARSGAAAAHLGGVERALAQAAIQLARRGHDVRVLCSTDGTPGSTRQEGVVVERVRRAAVLLRTPIVHLAGHIGPDAGIVHVPGTYPFTTGPALRRARRLGLPTVLDFHFEPHLEGFVGGTAAAAYRRWGHRSNSLADAVAVRSVAYARTAPGLSQVPDSKWNVVPNGIDPHRFRPAPSTRNATSDEGDGILFVGRLVPYKGVEVLLAAAARMRDAQPITVAGDGPLRAKLEGMAQRLGVRARFLGRVEDADLPGLYRSAALTVLPSVNRQEAFGMAILESMACGTPVVASDLPGVADVAREGGFVARCGNPQHLARQIERGLRPGSLPRGRPLAQRIHGSYSWEAVADRLEATYAHALGETPSEAAQGSEAPVAWPEVC